MADQPHVLYGSVQAQVFTGGAGNSIAAVQVDANGYLEVTFAPGVMWPCDLRWVAGVPILPVNAVNGTIYTIVPVGGTTRFVVAGAQSNVLNRNLLDTIGWARVETGDAAFAGAIQDDTVALTETTTRRLRVQTDLARINNIALVTGGIDGSQSVGGPIADDSPMSTLRPVVVGGWAHHSKGVIPSTLLNNPLDYDDAGYAAMDTWRRLMVVATGEEADDSFTDSTLGPVKVGGNATTAPTAVNDGRTGPFNLDLFHRLRISAMGEVSDQTADTAYNNPVKIGAVVDDVLNTIADGDMAQLVCDRQRRLRITGTIVDDSPADATDSPLLNGAVADAVLSLVADNDMVHLVADLSRRLYVDPQGNVADDAADDASNPVKIGGVADAVLSLVTDGDRVQAVFDLYRRLQVVIAGYDSGSNANRTFEIAPLNLQVLEESLLDTTNHAVSAGISYPSDDGLVMMGYKDLCLTGKLICGADNTVTMTVEATNDEDATPANRDWGVVYGYNAITNTNVNSIACAASTTVLFNWNFDEINCRYVRVRLVITNVGVLSNTIIIKIRRKAL